MKTTNSIAMLGVMLLGWCGVIAAGAQAPASQAQPAAGRGRGTPAPATRIVTFEAQPATIKPGGSALLVWHIENPPSATGFNAFGTIEPDLGRDNHLHVERRLGDKDGDRHSPGHETRRCGFRRICAGEH